MRLRAVLASVALALLVAVPAVRGDDDDDKGPKIPVNPFAVCNVGDWTWFDVTWKGGDIPDRHGWFLFKIKSIENDRDVTVTLDQKQNDTTSSAEYVFSKNEAPEVEKFGRMFSGVSFPGKVFDHKRKGDQFGINGTEFPGWKVTFRSETDNDTYGKYVLFFSKDVKASATVICRYDGKDGSKVEVRVQGYGSKGSTDWGKTAPGMKAAGGNQGDQGGEQGGDMPNGNGNGGMMGGDGDR